jgi:hypothetical protein
MLAPGPKKSLYGHMGQLDSQTIENRLREIADELARLQKEQDELDIAMRVLKRLVGQSSKPRAEPGTARQVRRPPPPPKPPSSARKNRKLGPARPRGLPSNFEIVEMILKSSEREGKNGLTAREIVEQIGKRYWPGVKGPQVLSFIYKFAKDDRIHKTSAGKFKSLHKNNEGSDGDARDH